MFRITTYNLPDSAVLKVEGTLTGPWVDELENCWRRTRPDGPVKVDLSDVCWVDDAGRDLLTLMYHAGVRFVARGCVIPELVKEISESPDLVRRQP
jgi:hypothetical protein